MRDAINIDGKFATFSDMWKPKRVAQLNDYDVRIVKVCGEFVWHSHAGTDELFLVWKGNLCIEFRDRTVALGPGDMYVVPRGTEHRPVAHEECQIVLVEPRGVVNTGDAGGEMTAEVQTI